MNFRGGTDKVNKSESIKNFADAMVKFQGEVKNPPKSADNPFFKSKYTPLDVLIDTAKPLLLKHGLSYMQSCSGDGSNITVTTLLMHSSGEWIESDPLTLKADKATAQGAGSAITYGRRYALAAALGLASDEDDDGNGAESNDKKKPTTPKPAGNGNSDDVITEAQAKRLFAISHGNADKVKAVIGKYGYESTKAIKKADYEKIVKEVEG
jgi:hypothetical protein